MASRLVFKQLSVEQVPLAAKNSAIFWAGARIFRYDIESRAQKLKA
jgi:hypothetical protein